ncbi:MAG TPA: hypothetical protein VIP06_04575 [Nocardioides sp.]
MDQAISPVVRPEAPIDPPSTGSGHRFGAIETIGTTGPVVRAERRTVGEAESRRANGPDWDRYADEYQATHGPFLGEAGFVWGPEGLTEADLGILGDISGKDVLELGSGACQCSRWVNT